MPTVIDATVVNQAYDTSGNGGRKLVRLSNGWLIAVAFNSGDNTLYVYKSEDNGVSWSQLCFIYGSNVIKNYFSVVNKGTFVYVLFRGGTTAIRFVHFDATTVTNTDQGASLFNLDTNQSDTGAVSLAINEAGTELHAAWASKNSTYPDSFNIRYAKGTINADGSVTWGAVEQVTKFNIGTFDITNPCIIVNSANAPLIITQTNNFYFSGTRYINGSGYSSIVALKRGVNNNANIDENWNYSNITTSTLYTQSSPSACVAPNGRIWVAWHGRDATDTNANNIRVAYSDDDGQTWTIQKITSGNDSNYHSQFASITVNRNNVVFVVYSYGSTTTTFDLAMNSYDGSWSGRTIIKDVASTSNRYPSTLFDTSLDFTLPLFVYNDFDKIGFYGTWTVTTISVTPGYIGQKTSADKSNILTYSITTDGTMSDITEKINGVTIATRTNPTSGQQFTVSLSQAQWDAIKFGNGHTLTIEMGSDTWTYTFDKRLNVNDDILSAVKGVHDLQDHLNAIKAQLASAIRSKGGTVNDTDAFTTMLSVLNGLQTKRWASGTVTSTSSSNTLQFILGNNTTSTWSYITVTGLTFKPSVIIARYKPTAYTTGIQIIYDSRGMIADYDVKIALGYVPYNSSSQPTYGFKEDGTKAYVNSDGFRLPASNDKTYEWIAFE